MRGGFDGLVSGGRKKVCGEMREFWLVACKLSLIASGGKGTPLNHNWNDGEENGCFFGPKSNFSTLRLFSVKKSMSPVGGRVGRERSTFTFSTLWPQFRTLFFTD